MRTCLNCDFENPDANTFCGKCGVALRSTSETEVNAKRAARRSILRKPIPPIVLAVVLGGVLFFLLAFHIVTDVPLIIPKDGLSFKDTLVTADGYLERYNKAPLYEKLRLSQTNLHRTLMRKRIIGRVGPDGVPRGEDGEPKIRRPDTAPLIEAAALHSAYDANEVNADNEYKGKWLVVDGKIAEIDTDLEGKPLVKLSSGQGYDYIECCFEESEQRRVAQLWKGQHVQILGLCAGAPIIDVCLHYCRIHKRFRPVPKSTTIRAPGASPRKAVWDGERWVPVYE